MISCGPRSGIHNENIEQTETDNYISEPTQLSSRERSEENGRKVYLHNCAACHFKDTRTLIGPGLGDVFKRLPPPAETYFIKYISQYDSMLKVDKYAIKVKTEYKDIESYHGFAILTIQQKNDLITYLKTWNRAVD